MLTLFDKLLQIRLGQANVKKWTDDIMPLLTGSQALTSPSGPCREGVLAPTNWRKRAARFGTFDPSASEHGQGRVRAIDK